jgi:hypothetical protein
VGKGNGRKGEKKRRGRLGDGFHRKLKGEERGGGIRKRRRGRKGQEGNEEGKEG